MTLRCGIIGAGRIAWKYDGGLWDGKRSVSHASCIARHPKTQLVAIMDPIAEARADFTENGPATASVAVCYKLDLFFAQDLDLVVIASPSDRHAADIHACLDAGIPHMLVEKPVTLTQADFKGLTTRVADMATPPRVVVNFFRRFLPQFHQLKTQLETREGTGAIHITYSRQMQINGVHLLDILGFLFGATRPPALDWLVQTDPLNPSFGLTMNGVAVTVTGQDLPYHALDVRFTDDRGRLSVVRGGLDILWEPKEDNPDYPGFYHLGLPRPLDGFPKAADDMRDGTYLALCNLVDTATPSLAPLQSAYFSQALMADIL